MDGLTAAVEIFKAGVWPCLAAVVLLTQRRRLGSMLDGMKLKKAELTKDGLKFETEEAIDRGVKLADEAVAQAIEAQAPAADGRQPARIAALNEQANQLIDAPGADGASPAEIVEAAWQRLQAILKEFLETTGHLSLGSNLHAGIIVKAAGMVDEISKPVALSIQQLYRARNLVRIDKTFEPSFTDAQRYAESANKVVYALIFSLESPVRG